MGFAIALLALTVVAVAALLAPLLRRRNAPEPTEAYNLAVYRDQLAEIERDRSRGLVAAEDAEAARAEIGRRILALPPHAAVSSGARGSAALAAGAALLLPFAAWIVYWQLGSPSLPDEPFADRGGAPTVAAANPHPDMASAVAKLAAHLRDHPDDLNGWVLLGRADLDLGRYDEAAEAYRHAVELSGRRPDIVGDWGEAQVMAAGGRVTDDAKQAFEAGLQDPETAPRSRYYLALAQLQQGDPRGALQAWVDLEADSPDDAEYLPILRRRIAETAKSAGIDPASVRPSPGKQVSPARAAAASSAPSPADVAATARATASATPEQREQMIRGMVANLAAKLEANPGDADGWARLGRSYMVLNDPAKAADAYNRAVKLRPDDPALKAARDEAAAAAKQAP